MLLHLSLQNLVPEIAIKKVDFLGHEDSEKLNEHPQVALVRTRIEAYPAKTHHLSLRLETLPPEVTEVTIDLYMHDRDNSNQDKSAAWELKHGERELHGGSTVLIAKEPERSMRIFTIEPERPKWTRRNGCIVLKRGPFGSNGHPCARYWMIYNVSNVGHIWDNSVSVSESDPDPALPGC